MYTQNRDVERERESTLSDVNGLVLITLFLFFLLSLNRFMHRDTKPVPIVRCQQPQRTHPDSSLLHDHRSEARLKIDPKVLVFVETTYSKLGREIAEELVYNRIKWVSCLKLANVVWFSVCNLFEVEKMRRIKENFQEKWYEICHRHQQELNFKTYSWW
jgi:hypothetical protein